MKKIEENQIKQMNEEVKKTYIVDEFNDLNDLDSENSS